MRLLVRADGGSRLGAGHLVRTGALAAAWRERGGDVTFVTSCDAPALLHRMAELGRVVAVDRPHPDPGDAETLARTLDEVRPDWVVLDGYHFGPEYQRAGRSDGVRVLVIDDVGHQPCYDADVLLNQNLGAERIDYSVARLTRRLDGPRYALLRPPFREARRPRRIADRAERVLVTLGGADPTNVTTKVVRALLRPELAGLDVTVVAGASNRHVPGLRAEIERAALGGRAAGRDGTRVRLLVDPPDLAERMAAADLAVSAAGSTCWELACLGVPAVVLVVADNQRRVAAGLEKVGAARSLGWHAHVDEDAIAGAVAALVADPDARRLQSLEGQRLVDGRGAERVIDAMFGAECDEPEPRVRAVAPEDVSALWRLANDAEVRRNSFSPERIPFREHERWFAAKLDSPGTRIWVLEAGGDVVGQIRYDAVGPDAAEITFAVDRAWRGGGLGTWLLRETGARALRELGIGRVRGLVQEGNDASAAAFLKAGFREAPQEHRRGYACRVFEFGHHHGNA